MTNKRILTIILTAIILAAASHGASASHRCSEEWKKKMEAERVAFIISETGITPEEAQVFWPVYNKVNKDRDEAMKNVFKAYKELNKAIEENKSEKEIADLLDKYLEAQKAQRQIDNTVADEYRKVLPADKVAKVFVAEEKFRRQHIRRLHGRPDGKPGSQANR